MFIETCLFLAQKTDGIGRAGEQVGQGLAMILIGGLDLLAWSRNNKK